MAVLCVGCEIAHGVDLAARGLLVQLEREEGLLEGLLVLPARRARGLVQPSLLLVLLLAWVLAATQLLAWVLGVRPSFLVPHLDPTVPIALLLALDSPCDSEP